mgnify:FL=1
MIVQKSKELKDSRIKKLSVDQVEGLEFILSCLPEEYEKAIRLRYKEYLSEKKISEKMEVTVERVHRMILSGVKLLAKPQRTIYVVEGFNSHNKNLIVQRERSIENAKRIHPDLPEDILGPHWGETPSVSVGLHRCFMQSFRRFECLWLFDFKPGHEPVELLPGQLFYFQLISGPAESALDFHTFIQQHKSVRFPEQSFDPVTTFSTEKIQGTSPWIHMELILYNSTQSVKGFPHIRSACLS